MTALGDLLRLPADQVRYHHLTSFIEEAEEVNALTESTIVELKERRDDHNLAEAIAALANTDGGLVLYGVSERKGLAGLDRITGVSLKEKGAVVDHLQNLLHRRMPEVVPLSIPESERFVMIFRVSAERDFLPVTVDGRVMLRFPGKTVGARREDIVSLVDRSRSYSSGGAGLGSSYHGARDMEFWPSSEVQLMVRVQMSGLLPSGATGWFNTSSKEAILEALQHSPVPNRALQGFTRSNERADQWWELGECRSTWLKIGTDWTPEHRRARAWSKAGSAYCHLDRRSLSACVAFGLRVTEDVSPCRLDLEELHGLTLATCLATRAAFSAAAGSLHPGPPVRMEIAGWFQSTAGRAVAVSGATQEMTEIMLRPEHVYWPLQQVREVTLDELDEVTRTWLELSFLDHGVSHFEARLEALPRPSWANVGAAAPSRES